jgi:alpha-D-ribose 1-methylphosphonate 5-triphosphate synthase subunit PhnH
MDSVDIEKKNRKNFRSLLDVLSMPGTIQKVDTLFDSFALSVASVLLYSEVSYLNSTDEDFTLIDAITNAKKQSKQEADYIFCDSLDGLLGNIKKGTYLSPEHSTTLICLVKSFDGIKVTLSGAGIDGQRVETYPMSESFVKEFNSNNKSYPLGNEIYFLNTTTGELKALSRTTRLEVA